MKPGAVTVLPPPPFPAGRSASDYPIPEARNLLLSLLAGGFAVVCLLAASRSEAKLALAGWALAFSFAMQLVYALIHQAEHGVLHRDPRVNHWTGVALAWLFPASFTMIRTTHQGHHLRNRTDYEMFDLYYPTDLRPLKFAQFYAILLGLFWPVVPIGALIAAISPRIFRLAPFRRALSTSYLLGDIRDEQKGAIRIEVALNVLVFAALFAWCDLRLGAVAWCYAAFAFNWSTRQYVSHAFTPRQVYDGALNLRTDPVSSLLLLRGEWDLNHHRYPTIPWIHLPRVSASTEQRGSYLRQYLRQWLGPRLCTEPAPEAVTELPLSLWPRAERTDRTDRTQRTDRTDSADRSAAVDPIAGPTSGGSACHAG